MSIFYREDRDLQQIWHGSSKFTDKSRRRHNEVAAVGSTITVPAVMAQAEVEGAEIRPSLWL